MLALLGELLILPTGLVTVAFLTRRLGAVDYGVYALAVTVVYWIEHTIDMLFSRTVIRLVGQADDPAPLLTLAFRLRLAIDLLAAAALWLCAGAVAGALGEAQLTTLLRVFAVDIPLGGMAKLASSGLMGMRRFRRRGFAAAARWTVRLALIVVLVESGLGIMGAILGSIGASIAELASSGIRPGFAPLARGVYPVKSLLAHTAPLFLYGATLAVFSRLDLVLLKLLGPEVAEVGRYAAAQTVGSLPAYLTLVVPPALIAIISRRLADGAAEEARAAARSTYRGVLLLVPFIAIVAANAGGVAALLFGRRFAASGEVLAVLLWASLFAVVGSVSCSILVGAGRLWSPLFLAGPATVAAGCCDLLVIPRFGALGAACVTAFWAGLAALAAVVLVKTDFGAAPPRCTAVRITVVTAGCTVAAWLIPSRGPLVLVELVVLCTIAVAALFVLGEVQPGELRRLLWSVLTPGVGGPPAAPSSTRA